MDWRFGIRLALILVVVTAGLVLTGQDVNLAQSAPKAAPQWYLNLPPNQPGFPVALSGAFLNLGSSPTLADLDNNGTLEVIIGGRDLAGGNLGCGGWVYAYRHNGTLLWQTHVRAPVNSTPSVADLNGDGYPDVVASMGGVVDKQCWHGGVIALDGRNGQELWTFDTQDWQHHYNYDGWRDGVYSTPAIGDIDGDGELEITFGAWDQCIYLLDRNGTPLWGNLPGLRPETYCGGHGYYNEDTVWSSPALADVTGDGRQEIIVGADVSGPDIWGSPDGGYLYIFDADGNALAREWMDQVIYSSPAVADLDNDGEFEFVVGTGTYWANKGYYVSAFDYNPAAADPADRLVLKWRKTTTSRVFASPAIADLNQDGGPDVVITSPIGEWGTDGSYVYAWRGQDGSLLFQRRVCNFMGQSQNTHSSPTVADIDGDQAPEILFSHTWEVAILNNDGTYYTDYSNPQWPGGPVHPGCARDHRPDTELSYYAEWSLWASPAVGDLDGDGDAEVVIGGHNPDNPNQGMLFAWTGHSTEHWPAWPSWHHDERNTGNFYSELFPPTNPTSLRSPSHPTAQWSTSNQVQMVWAGADDQESGIAGYSIVWDTTPDTLPDTTLDLGATTQNVTSPPLPDGKMHYFHLRTGDKAGNWTAGALHYGPFWIDAEPPTSQASSPALVSEPFQVTWSGSDAGSGISHYTIQVRDNDGQWTNWLEKEIGSLALYQGASGHTYRFRSIAHDNMGHSETDYTADGDTSTIVAEHLLSGTVYDHRAQPVAGSGVSAQPSALNQATSDTQGAYTLGLASSGAYDLTASHAQHGSLPPMKGVTVNADLSGVNLYLPPDPNLVQNGGFEAQNGWTLGGPIPPAPVRGQGHTGDFALQLGGLPTLPQAGFESSSPDLLSETTHFTNTSTGDAPLTYEWDFGDGSAPSSATNPTHTYATLGTFTVILTASNAFGEDAFSDIVEIVARPEPPIAGFESSSPDTLGQTTRFTNTSTGSLPIAYTWSFSDGITSTLEAPTHTYATTDTFTVILTAANALGQDVFSDTVEITPGGNSLLTARFQPTPAAPSTWTWSVSQTISLPKNISEATLAWIYWVEGNPGSKDVLTVQVVGTASDLSQPLSLDTPVWTHRWLDVSEFAGQQVTVYFELEREATDVPLSVWLDEVTLGTTAATNFTVYLPLVLRNH